MGQQKRAKMTTVPCIDRLVESSLIQSFLAHAQSRSPSHSPRRIVDSSSSFCSVLGLSYPVPLIALESIGRQLSPVTLHLPFFWPVTWALDPDTVTDTVPPLPVDIDRCRLCLSLALALT
jgi:hypothetical protein